jgi:uncharacterized protein YeaO (DUF488 family)
MKPVIQIKRAYDKPSKKDGYRVLIDRLWPRGVTKEAAAINEWVKEIAPSTSLRKWFNHDPERWTEFQKKYKTELKKNKAVEELAGKWSDHELITFVYAGKDTEHTHALVLQQYLQQI